MYYVYLKKKNSYIPRMGEGEGQMIVWPPHFSVWGGHGPLAPPPVYATVHMECSDQEF